MDSGGELSYDDSVPYEDQVSLAERIGSTKVYLLSDATRRKLTDVENDAVEGEDMDTDQGTPLSASTDPSLRPNAILLSGPPIAHLPTARIFDYAAHFDVCPLALEWIDDKTCIFVFPSNSAARSAFVALQKPNSVASPPPPTDATTDARPIPVGLWPPEDRIHHSLGVGQGLKGTLSMRWARVDDKKKRNAKRESAFYRKHGVEAGKESVGFGVVPVSVAVAVAGDADGALGSLAKRLAVVGDTLEERIEMDGEGDAVAEVEGVREWDRGKPGVEDQILPPSRKRKRGGRDDVDEFLGDDLAEEEENGDASPPSKMRSDYIAEDGRTVIGSADGAGLVERIRPRLPRRTGTSAGEEEPGSRRRGGRGRRRMTSKPPRKKTREELDDELDAFLNDRD